MLYTRRLAAYMAFRIRRIPLDAIGAISAQVVCRHQAHCPDLSHINTKRWFTKLAYEHKTGKFTLLELWIRNSSSVVQTVWQ